MDLDRSTTSPCRWIILCAVALVVLSGCATRQQPDLDRIYDGFARRDKSHPVIVIPGVFGSRLNDPSTGSNVWPGGLWNLATGANIRRLRLSPDPSSPTVTAGPDLEPGTLFDRMAGQDYYHRLVQTLTRTGKYRCVYPDNVSPQTDCVLFTWDWRRDLVRASRRLDGLIDRLRRVKGQPDLTVDVVAHSAGGLVTRYFARYGSRDVLEEPPERVPLVGARKIHRAVLIATPNFGSIHALQRAIMGQPVGLTEIPPETLASMSGMYQLLPHPDRTWMIDVHGNRLERDLYDTATWQRYEWSLYDQRVRGRIRAEFERPERARRYLNQYEQMMARSLRRAERFHQALSVPVREAPMRYVVFGSSCKLTPSTCVLERVDGEVKIRLLPEHVVNKVEGVDYERLMLAPGDGSVTKASLLARDDVRVTRRTGGYFPIDYAVFICEDHARYTSNVTFQNNLMNILSSG